MSDRQSSGPAGFFEAALWRGRYVIIIAVIGSAAMALAAIVVASVDAAGVARESLAYLSRPGGPAREAARAEILGEIVKALDLYLVAAMMGISAMGLYELFIGKIGPAEESELAQRMLLIRSLDDLKHRLGSLVILILVTTFFQIALKMTYERPLDLLFLACGTALLAAATFFGRRHFVASEDAKHADATR